MAQKISVNRLTNANVYIDGRNLLGRAEEITLPDIKHKLAEHKALGMVGTVEFFAGIDKMEARVKWNSYYADVMKTVSNPFKTVKLQCRASLEQYTSEGRIAEVPLVCFITGAFKNVPMGNYKQHDNVEVESQLTVYYCRMEISGEVVLEIDVLANIYKVNGEDVLSQYRANIGG